MTDRKTVLGVPGPRPFPIAGNRVALLQLAGNPLQRMSELFRTYGDVVALLEGGGTRVFSTNAHCPGTIFVRGSELVREVETNSQVYHRSPLSGVLFPRGKVSKRKEPLRYWATGLFAVNDDEHRRHRGMILPAFHPQRIKSYFDPIKRITNEHLARWEAGAVVDLADEMMNLTRQVATTCFFGLDAQDCVTMARAQADSMRLVLSPSVILAPYDIPGLPYRKFLDAVRTFYSEMQALLDERRRSPSEQPDVLSMLMNAADESGRRLSDNEIIGHASVIFAAGHETTAHALTWAILLLSQHQNCAAAVLDEISRVVGDDSVRPEHLDHLVELDNVIKETLRIAPSAPWNTRTTTRPTKLGGYELPTGTEVIASIFHTHRLPELYKEADRFMPERWKEIRRNQYEFNPFGGGPRTCIGASFAWMEMKIVLVEILRQRSFRATQNTRMNPVLNITMSLKDSLDLQVDDAGKFSRDEECQITGTVHELVDFGIR